MSPTGFSGETGEGGVKDAVFVRRARPRGCPLRHCGAGRKAYVHRRQQFRRLRRRPLSRHRRELRRAVASAYCKSRDYAEAGSFRKIEREEIAGAVPTTTGTSARDEFVAIECLR